MRGLSVVMASSRQQSTSRTGLHLRAKLLQAANKAVSVTSTYINNALDDDDAARAPKTSPYTEERCLVFVRHDLLAGVQCWVAVQDKSPLRRSLLIGAIVADDIDGSSQPGWAYVRKGELTVGLDGFAFALRPLESASRTQKLFVSAARQLTSLPNLPKPLVAEEPLDIEIPPDELAQQVQQYNEHNKDVQAPTQERTLIHEGPIQSQRLLPSRQSTTSSMATVGSSMTTSSNAASLRPLARVTYSNASLDILHDNLNTRLRLFFSQKLVNRRIRVSVYLIPKVDEEEVCVAKGTLLTELGGVFKSSICVPWKSGDPSGRRLRVRTELLTDAEVDATIDDEAALKQALGRSDEAICAVSHAHAPIRVISDIDDTIKATHVLAGMKAVMRNVFTRPHDELECEGMKDWYCEMHERGACFHFVSNSPFELFGVLREYLNSVGFPPGSVRLKEYGGGSGSLLGGLWEQAGSRKRGGVEEILRTFPDSRFLLVGDSGEQDLELYVSLAAQYPQQILGVFIRDVTTPIRKGLHSASTLSLSSTGSTSRAKPPPLPPRPGLQQRKSDAEQEKVLIDLAAEGAFSSKPKVEETKARVVQQKTPSSSIQQKAPQITSTAPSQQLQSMTIEDEGDDQLSPNNPLRRNSFESGMLTPFNAEGYTELEQRVVAIFADRVKRARSELPKGVLLKLFRHGDECREDAARLMDGVQAQ